MSKPDKDKIIPWLGVIFAGLVLGALGRYIALQQSGDTGTANLTFVIMLGGIVFMYFLFITLCESVSQLFAKKKTSISAQSTALPEDDDEDDNQPGQSFGDSDVYPYIGGGNASDEPDDKDSGEEETEFPTAIAPVSPKIDWKEQREREFQEKLSPFREYTHFAMGPYVSEAELARLDEYVELFAREVPLPKDATPIRHERLKNPDLYHFGWNMQNYFKVGKREDVVPWLQTVFSALRDLEFSTIKGKLHDPQTRRHTIPNIDDIPRFMVGKKP